MARIKESDFGGSPYQKLLGHNQQVLVAWVTLGEVLETDGLLSAELKEQVRRMLAQENGCEYCKAKGKPEPHLFDEKTSVAVGFAEVFLKHPKDNIPDSAFQILGEYFNQKEISELCAFICFSTAQQFFGAMMKLEPSLV